MLNKFCFCCHLDKGCIIIGIVSIALSGCIFVVQKNVWSIVGLVLGLLSAAFLLLGTAKYPKASTITYLFFEIIHITEMCVATIAVFVDVIVFKQFTCECYNNDDCEDVKKVCERLGILFGSICWTYSLIGIYFWICVLNFLLEIYK